MQIMMLKGREEMRDIYLSANFTAILSILKDAKALQLFKFQLLERKELHAGNLGHLTYGESSQAL